MHSFPSRNTAARKTGGFTLVELLVVIGIIAILAGVALGPITNGIRKARESAAMQTCRTLALAEFQYSNDNNGSYPDSTGTLASDVAEALFSGNYVSDPSVFILSGDSLAVKYVPGSGTTAAAWAKTNCSYDFTGVTTHTGVTSSSPDQLPLVWTPDKQVPTIPTSAGGAEFVPNNPIFGTDGIAVAYHSNNSFFRAPVGITPAAGAYPDTKGDALYIDNSFVPTSGVVYAQLLGAQGF